MSHTKPNLVWPLRLIAAATLIGPALLFASATWANHRSIDQRSTERIESALDIIQEHALKVLQTIERTIAETNEVLRGLSDDEIRADEKRLSRRLKQTQDALPQMQSIWAFDREGRPLLSSTVLSVPPTLNNADRDYFRAQVERDAGTFIGDIVQARVGSFRFFVISGRRPERPEGGFNGVIAVSVVPEHFREFYGRLSRGVADSFGLIRADGAFLARYPTVLDRPEHLNAQSSFARAIQSQPDAGLFTATSQLDGVERRIGYRKLPGYPVHVLTGIETAAIGRELRALMLGHLAFGLPTSLAMFGLALYALRRTERFQAEVLRREVAEVALKQAQRLEAVGQLTGGGSPTTSTTCSWWSTATSSACAGIPLQMSGSIGPSMPSRPQPSAERTSPVNCSRSRADRRTSQLQSTSPGTYPNSRTCCAPACGAILPSTCRSLRASGPPRLI
jgi:two-component system, NtrC family, sensor kinase